MRNPISTYRLQFNKDFTLKDLDRIIPYLEKLGIGSVYASPVFAAVPGSIHGYDVINPHIVNPEIGTLGDLDRISKHLNNRGIGWLQDIVPNHMAFHSHNAWLMDVLEKGQRSAYASYFDITWTSSLFHGRLMLPFLGTSLEEAITNGELTVNYQNERFVLKYYEAWYPLHLHSYRTILEVIEPTEVIQQLIDQTHLTLQIEDIKSYTLQWDEFRRQLASLMKDEVTKNHINHCIENVNNSVQLRQKIVDEQVYRLCEWQKSDEQMNYRRFFTVNGLICLNMQDQQVFDDYHQLIRSMLKENIFHGLRIDHIDGLYDPSQYLQQLRKVIGDDTYLVVEKILEPGETLPKTWPIQGTTGYDFLSVVNDLFTQNNAAKKFSRFYNRLVDDTRSINEQIREKKAHILYHHMAGELSNLYHLFLELNLVSANTLSQVKSNDIKEAIGEFLIHCPVYRYYANQFPLEGEEFSEIETLCKTVKVHKPALSDAVHCIEKALLEKPMEGDRAFNRNALHFYQRCMQFTGPLMAKGVEDTLMYTYNRFIGHNEVGDSPDAFLLPDDFHEKMKERQHRWPLAMNATSTHDTKRGEDVRARLNVLTDIPDEWIQVVQEWQHLNHDLKINNAPDDNDEYFIYQTLVGAYPMPAQGDDNFGNRLQEYLTKALREAKRHSNWNAPNETYEESVKEFASKLLDKSRPFWKSFKKFHQRIVDFGIINSLSQMVLKFTCPGVPDVYQGCELWDLSLVDPDNRRNINYELREEWLGALQATTTDPEELLEELWEDRYNAQLKLWLMHQLLLDRHQHSILFTTGHYIPLTIEGKFKRYVLAFARRYKNDWYVVVVPRHLAELCKEQNRKIQRIDWKDTQIILPPEMPNEWDHQLTKEKGKAASTILVKKIFRVLPFAILKFTYPLNERGAGVLMHVTSLPSHYGIGDLGYEAYAFADFLSKSNQSYWQMLPLNPVEKAQAYSPYSSISSMAGNTLLLDPEWLVKEQLLEEKELLSHRISPQDKVNFEEAQLIKNTLFENAYIPFIQEKGISVKPHHFEKFKQQEAYWLNDFALYSLLKKQHDGKPWYEWPEQLKHRHPETLQQLEMLYVEALDKIKWKQFVFSIQWKSLKQYCNSLNIQLFGDLPFYVSYDSVDVWSNPNVFCLDNNGNMTGIAGVPPDYFNENGQLWGMPVFRWDVLKMRGYDWWINRLRKNIELYDLLRLDHFRAFSNYWEVPATESTAINGTWRTGPGLEFFKILQKELGELPFVAEDLGDISEEVYQLRDAMNLPGMKVLQFAFDENLAHSDHIPHNYTSNFIVYTGTHDNNTTRGWYRENISNSERRRIKLYTGEMVKERNIHNVLARLAYASVARIAVLPVQDLLGLDETGRINTPASIDHNWLWRLKPGAITNKEEHRLRELTKMYNRI